MSQLNPAMNPSGIEFAGTLCLALAIIHTFAASWFQKRAASYPEGSKRENLFHLLGEVETVFGIWSAVFLAVFAAQSSLASAVSFFEGLSFREPLFVFAIMTVAATKPALDFVERLISGISRLIPGSPALAFYGVCLSIGPLLGSFITEPAAMTVLALLILQKLFRAQVTEKFRYATLGLLFVNVSIGGTLTHFAAPPVLMVANQWQWDTAFLFTHFGWKAMIAVFSSTMITAFIFRHELTALQLPRESRARRAPGWVQAVHLLFLAAMVASAHHSQLCIALLLFFLGFCTVTREFQVELKIRESLLVAFFLGGLVVLGTQQRWWLEPLLTSLNSFSLFSGATLLTAITDNAALTYLGAQVPDLSPANRYALVAGAVTGGGLTVIANAPNPAGFAILNPAFGESGIQAGKLFLGALLPTLIAAICFWLIP